MIGELPNTDEFNDLCDNAELIIKHLRKLGYKNHPRALNCVRIKNLQEYINEYARSYNHVGETYFYERGKYFSTSLFYRAKIFFTDLIYKMYMKHFKRHITLTKATGH